MSKIITSKKDLELIFNKEDFIFAFESRGTTFLFEELVFRHYIQWDSLSFFNGKIKVVWLSKTEEKRMNEIGAKYTIESTKAAVKQNKDIAAKIAGDIPHIQKKEFTKDVAEHMFTMLREALGMYTYFDVSYTDGVYGKDDEVVTLIGDSKNDIRGNLNIIYFGSESWLGTLVRKFSNEFNIPENKLEWYMESELMELFDGKIVSGGSLETRTIASVGIVENGEHIFLAGEEALKIWKQFTPDTNKKEFSGVVAHGSGTVTGKVRILRRDYSNKEATTRAMDEMRDGEILITETTDPDLMPALRKASAIITDVGGLLSHAAISARELDTPCIVGTEVATKVLKNGDMVEVDMDKGVVKIII